MLTIFTTPKAFIGQFAIIQENALASWKEVIPEAEIIIFGNEYGAAKVAKKYELKHIKEVKTNRIGTPLVSHMFQKAAVLTENPYLMYANCDIVFLENPTRSIKNIKMESFLVSGQRWDLDVNRPMKFKKEWDKRLKEQLKKKGKLHQVGGMDYFIFPKSFDFNMPPFAVGRGIWDNWLIYRAKLLKIPVVDATKTIPVIHQNHDYSHAGGYSTVWFGEEHIQNLKLAKEKRRPFNLTNADFVLTEAGLKKPKLSIYRLWRNFQTYPITRPGISYVAWPVILSIEFAVKVKQKFFSVKKY